MKKIIQLNRFMLLLVAMLTMSLTQVWGEDVNLTFPDDNSSKNKVSGYDKEWTAITGKYSFSIANFNNNQWNNDWECIKCGRKKPKSGSGASVATITSPLMDFKVDSIVVTFDDANATLVNSFKLQYANNKDFTSPTEMSKTIAKGNICFAITNPTDSMFYRIIIDCKEGTANGFVVISALKFYEIAGTGPSLEVSPEAIKFDNVLVGTASVAGKEVAVKMANIEEVLLGFSTNSPFKVDKESLTKSDTVIVTPVDSILTLIGEHVDTLIVTDAELTKKVPVSIKVVEPALVNNVAFAKDSAKVMVGKTLKLEYTIAPDSAIDKSVSFQSLNEAALTVAEDGTITGVAENASVAVVITALDSLNKGDKLTDTCWVTIVPIPMIPVSSVNFTKSFDTIQAKSTTTLTYTIAPEDATDKSVSFESLDKKALVVNEKTGEVQAGDSACTVAVVIAALDSLNKSAKLTDTCWVTIQKKVVPTYVRVTSARTDWSGEYVLAYESEDSIFVWKGYDKQDESIDKHLKAKAGEIELSDPVTIVIAKSGDGYSIQVKGGTNDGKYLGGKLSGTAVANGIKFNDDPQVNTITFEDGTAKIVAPETSILRYNPQGYFRYYKPTSTVTGIIHLFVLKQSGEPTAVSSVSFVTKSESIEVGQTAKLNYSIAPDFATDKRVEFLSKNTDALTVAEDGTITGVAENASVAVIITALDSLNKGTKLTDTCFVEVKAATPKPVLHEINTIANLIACYDAGVVKDNDSVKVTGYISNIFLKPTNFAKYGSATVWLCGTESGVGTDKEFQLYNCYGQDGDTLASFAPEATGSENVDVDEVIGRNGIKYQAGDSIVACGKIKKYNTTYELDGGCYIISGGAPTAINEIKAIDPKKTIKVVENGKVVIYREGVKYNALGQIME